MAVITFSLFFRLLPFKIHTIYSFITHFIWFSLFLLLTISGIRLSSSYRLHSHHLYPSFYDFFHHFIHFLINFHSFISLYIIFVFTFFSFSSPFSTIFFLLVINFHNFIYFLFTQLYLIYLWILFIFMLLFFIVVFSLLFVVASTYNSLQAVIHYYHFWYFLSADNFLSFWKTICNVFMYIFLCFECFRWTRFLDKLLAFY